MLARLVDGEEVKIESEFLDVAVEPVHLPVLKDQRVFLLLLLSVILHVYRVLEDLPRDVELSSIGLQKLGLFAGDFVGETLQVGSCYVDPPRVRHEVDQPKQVPIHQRNKQYNYTPNLNKSDIHHQNTTYTPFINPISIYSHHSFINSTHGVLRFAQRGLIIAFA